MREVWVYDAIRTPFGKLNGGLAAVRPDDMLAHLLRHLSLRNPSLATQHVAEVVIGNSNGAGEDASNVARASLILASYPMATPGITVNRICGSGLDSVILASRLVAVGDGDVVIAGGVESMSRAPSVFRSNIGHPRSSGVGAPVSTAIGLRFPNPRLPKEALASYGDIAEHTARRFSISRTSQDEYAVESHRRATLAWANGEYAREVVPIPSQNLVTDESIRPATTVALLSTLRPVFDSRGTVTAGNSSPLSDGAAVVLIGSPATGLGSPLAVIKSHAVIAMSPQDMCLAPVQAANKALGLLGATWADIAHIEVTEAFAAQILACRQMCPEMDQKRLNPNGGAIAIGHPLAASGTRLIGHLAHALHRRGGGLGIAACGVGMGQGVAIVLEGL